MRINNKLRAIANQQAGYFTTRQADAAGYGRNLRSYHAKSGNWLRVDRALYRLKGYPNTPDSELIRWSLWAAGQNRQRLVVVGRASALYYYGLSTVPPDRVELAVDSAPLPHGDGCQTYVDALSPEDYFSGEVFQITTPSRTLRDMRSDLLMRHQWTNTIHLALEKKLISNELARSLLGEAVLLRECSPQAKDADALKIERPFAAAGTGRSEVDRQARTFWFGRGASAGRGMANRSFTLVEMLVVIVIISILSALLLPALNRSVESARTSACANQQRQIYFSIMDYTESYYSYLPAMTQSGEALALSKLDLWIQMNSEMHYPSDLANIHKSIFTCPSQSAFYGWGPTSYGHNSFDSSGAFGGSVCGRYYKITNIKGISTFPFVACMGEGYASQQTKTYPNFRGDQSNLFDTISSKHSGEASFLMLGGTAKIFPRYQWNINSSGLVPDWFPWKR